MKLIIKIIKNTGLYIGNLSIKIDNIKNKNINKLKKKILKNKIIWEILIARPNRKKEYIIVISIENKLKKIF